MPLLDEPAALIPIHPGMSEQHRDSAIGQNFQILQKSTFETQMFRDETGTPRILFGRLPDGTYGLVISKPGVDVKDVFV